MELKDTVELMNSDRFDDRMKAEYCQTLIRAEKLTAMLNKWKENKLDFEPKCSYELLFEQLIYMRNYLVVLKERAKIEGMSIDTDVEAGE